MARTFATKKRAADSDSEPETVSKRVKSGTSLEADGKDDDGNPYWELSNKRRVGVSDFSKKTFVNIREYYDKDGKTLPGKKGISLSIEQYNAFLKAVPQINAALRAKGLVVEGDVADEPDTALIPAAKAKKERKKSPKANIETTSEEED
ncbi:transcriptional Coactivator p15-domain-containing protein [Fusarium redolens]|uniref:Transcriptional Coactivator p15-domain-containing protein n=1 Tax=Fusarium redolens TaxID=48865 RepID=A0A9P9KFS9_FUSRE|nr:transcriptional Coactivator p15-domain-containing protein [Fusarium redolens]KAH7255600.1 transcriptional Coactivator p15-domain-containing protein [Fusarium redolens]